MSRYNIKVDIASYNDEFHNLAIWKLRAFLPNSVLAKEVFLTPNRHIDQEGMISQIN